MWHTRSIDKSVRSKLFSPISQSQHLLWVLQSKYCNRWIRFKSLAYLDLCIPKTILLKDKTFVSMYYCFPSPSVTICCSPNREAFAKPNCDDVLQPEPRRCEGCITLSPSGLTNVNTWKGMFYFILSSEINVYQKQIKVISSPVKI